MDLALAHCIRASRGVAGDNLKFCALINYSPPPYSQFASDAYIMYSSCPTALLLLWQLLYTTPLISVSTITTY